MKIDSDLRAAIRCAEKSQPDNHTIRAKAREEALANFFKQHPAKSRRIASAASMRKEAKALNEKACDIEAEMGLRGWNGAVEIANDDKFVKSGGKLKANGRAWKFDEVMSELAAAEPKQLKPILKKYGINWE